MTKLAHIRIFTVVFALATCSTSLHATSLTAGTTTINLTCTKGSPCASSGTSTLAISAGTGYFTVTPPSVPWLLITPATGTATTTASANVLTFSASPAWTTLGSGLYTTTATIASLGVTSATVTVTLQVNDAAPTLSVSGSVNILNPVSYLAGAASPTMSITLFSSDGLAIPFTAVASSSLTPEGVAGGWLTPASQTGIAYSWGTTLSYAASSAALTQAQAGDSLVGTITITPANGTALILPVSINVGAPVATITSVSPSVVPLLTGPVAPGFVTLVVKGTNFVSTAGSQKTKVFVGASQVLTDNVTIVSSNFLTVAIPYDSTGGVFKTAGATALAIGVANGASPSAPIGATVSVGVSSAPIISTITSASAFVEPVGAAAPKAAPYDMLSIFGQNLCPLCTGSNGVLVGAPDAVYGRFPTFLSPDASATTPHKITVTFSKPGTPATLLPGYLLFATGTQINVLVPGALATLTNAGVVNVQVGYDTVTPALAANTSAVFAVSNVLSNPGVFTVSSNGRGAGAITDASSFVLNTAAASATATTSTVAIFLTGLGTPDSAGTNVATGSPTYGTNCLAPLGVAGATLTAPTGYMGTVLTPFNAGTIFSPASGYVVPSWTSIDGAVIRSSLLQGNFAPCFITASLPTVTIGGAAATVTSAGFVSDSIAGLYQINALVPTPTDSPTYASGTPQQYQVIVTRAGVSSQLGVMMWVQ